MPRRYRRRRSYSIVRPLKKYSNETYVLNLSKTNDTAEPIIIPTGDNLIGIYSPTASTLGTRKAKNFTVSLSCDVDVPFMYALVYVPEGTDPSTLTVTPKEITGAPIAANSLYEPNQNVIMTGMFGGPSGQIVKSKSRLARNLNSNDYIILIVAPIADITIPVDTGVHICASLLE